MICARFAGLDGDTLGRGKGAAACGGAGVAARTAAPLQANANMHTLPVPGQAGVHNGAAAFGVWEANRRERITQTTLRECLACRISNYTGIPTEYLFHWRG